MGGVAAITIHRAHVARMTSKMTLVPVITFQRKMGYVNGKTEVDLLLEEDDVQEDYEKIAVIQVITSHSRLHHVATRSCQMCFRCYFSPFLLVSVLWPGHRGAFPEAAGYDGRGHRLGEQDGGVPSGAERPSGIHPFPSSSTQPLL